MFWDDIDSRFIRVMKAGDYETVNIVADESMRTHYHEYRTVINEIVFLAQEQNRFNEKMAERKEQFIDLGMICIIILLFLTLITVELILLHLFGMFLVREILSLTDITIKETGVPGKGARFEITVPKEAFRNDIAINDSLPL